MPENPPPGLDEIHGSLTAPLLPSLEGSEVLGAPASPPLTPTNPTLPTLTWDPTTTSGVVSVPPQPAADPVAPAAADPQARVETGPASQSPEAVPPVPPSPSVAGPPTSATTVDSAPPAAPVPAVPPAPESGVVNALAAPGPTGAPPVAVVPMLPNVAPVAPAPSSATGAPDPFAAPLESPAAPAIPGQGDRSAVGEILRTLVIAALVAGAVFAGRYGWDWNEDRQRDAATSDVLPAAAVPAVDVRFVTFRGGDDGQVTAGVDLATGDFAATISGSTELARRGTEYWVRQPGGGPWVPASPELLDSVASGLATIEEASLTMISDVLPVGVHPFVTVTADEMVVLAGPTFDGPEVIEVTDPALEPSDEAPATTPPTGGRVLARHLTVTVDRLALRTADPLLAETSHLGGTSPLVIDLWVDGTGVVHRMTATSPGDDRVIDYALISASSDGSGPLVDLGLPDAVPQTPATEVSE